MDLISELQSASVFKLGEYTLKGGFKSPIYIDFRVLISHPKLMRAACDALWHKINAVPDVQFDYVCGVPYGAVPYASVGKNICVRFYETKKGQVSEVFWCPQSPRAKVHYFALTNPGAPPISESRAKLVVPDKPLVLSVLHDVPMVTRRKDVKDYGTKRRIEGDYKAGASVLVIEDVVTSGASIVETVEILRSEGLIVKDVLILLDRQQGSEVTFERASLTAHRVLTMSDLLTYMVKNEQITSTRSDEIKQILATGAVKKPPTIDWSLTARFIDNANNVHPCCVRLCELMIDKHTNLCVAADMTKAEDVLKLATAIGPHICMLKLHSDMIGDADAAFFSALKKLANEQRFMLFEDRKLADTCTTVARQLTAGPFDYLSWADFVTVHALPGKSVLEAVRQAAQCAQRSFACLLVAEMSCEKNLTRLPGYIDESVRLAVEYRDVVAGFICQKRRAPDNPTFMFVSPGVHLEHGRSTSDGQQFRSPTQACSGDGNDVLVVGRGVTQQGADKWASAAQRYAEAGWAALLERDGNN